MDTFLKYILLGAMLAVVGCGPHPPKEKTEFSSVKKVTMPDGHEYWWYKPGGYQGGMAHSQDCEACK